MTVKPFAPTNADIIQRGDKILVPKGTKITRPGKNRTTRVEQVTKRDITVTCRHELSGHVSWGAQKSSEGTADAQDIEILEYVCSEPTVDFGYLRDVLGLGQTRQVAWYAAGVDGYPALGSDLRYVSRYGKGDPLDYHSTRLPLDTALTLYTRIAEHRDAERKRIEDEVSRYGWETAFVRNMLRDASSETASARSDLAQAAREAKPKVAKLFNQAKAKALAFRDEHLGR